MMPYITEDDGCAGPVRESDTGAWFCPCELEGDAPDNCEDCPLYTYYVASHTNEEED